MDFLNNFTDKITNFRNNKNKSKSKESDFDEFIKTSFIQFINQSNLFKDHVDMYEKKSFGNGCNELFVITEDFYKKAFKSIENIPYEYPIPSDINIKRDKLRIFHIEDLKTNTTLYNNKYNQKYVNDNKEVFCKLIAVIFVRIYILIKGIYTTFNINLKINDNPLTDTADVPISINPIDPTDPTDRILHVGGGMFDIIKGVIPSKFKEYIGMKDNKDDEDIEDIEDDENDGDDEDPANTIIKTYKYNNIIIAFFNAINDQDLDKEFNFNTYDLKAETINLDILKNLKSKEFTDLLCYKKTVIKHIEENMGIFTITNETIIGDESTKYKEIFNKIEADSIKKNMSEQTKCNNKAATIEKYIKNIELELCKKNIKNLQSSGINSLIIECITEMATEYTVKRTELYNEIVKKIFIFDNLKKPDEASGDKVSTIIGLKNNITYQEIITLTYKAKIMIYDLYINFFEKLIKIIKEMVKLALTNKKTILEPEPPAPDPEPKPEPEPEPEPPAPDPEPKPTSEEQIKPIPEEPQPPTELKDQVSAGGKNSKRKRKSKRKKIKKVKQNKSKKKSKKRRSRKS